MKKVYINDGWSFYNEKTGTVSATVPGCVHTDLKKCGKIDDYYWRDNNDACQWIENEDFTYTCTFDAEESAFSTLVFEGLDTYCEIYLNGERIGGAQNMFIPHEYFLGGKLKSKGNELRVEFRSPIKEIENMPERSGAFTKERITFRWRGLLLNVRRQKNGLKIMWTRDWTAYHGSSLLMNLQDGLSLTV